MPALLEVRDLTVHYATENEPTVAVNNVSLDVEEGEVVGLLGESGCGKTTLLLAILGLLSGSARVVMGSIRFRGRDLRALGDDGLRELRGAQVSIVFQEPTLALNPVRRVGAQVAEVVRAHHRWSGRRCREEALAILAEVGLEEPLRIHDSYPHELSGGQLQRVVIAQALVCRPALVLADEPTASLDSTTQAELRVLLGTLRDRFGLALLLVSPLYPRPSAGVPGPSRRRRLGGAGSAAADTGDRARPRPPAARMCFRAPVPGPAARVQRARSGGDPAGGGAPRPLLQVWRLRSRWSASAA